MALNVALQVYRGTRTNLASLASTGHAGVLAWTTDSNELFVDSGTGTGIGTGNAWLPIANDIAVFASVANQAAMVALAAKVGDIAIRTDNSSTYVLTAYPASAAANWVVIASVPSGATVTGLASGTAQEWVSYIDTSGVQHLSQPAFTDISSILAQSQLPASIGSGSNLTSIDCGSF